MGSYPSHYKSDSFFNDFKKFSFIPKVYECQVQSDWQLKRFERYVHFIIELKYAKYILFFYNWWVNQYNPLLLPSIGKKSDFLNFWVKERAGLKKADDWESPQRNVFDCTEDLEDMYVLPRISSQVRTNVSLGKDECESKYYLKAFDQELLRLGKMLEQHVINPFEQRMVIIHYNIWEIEKSCDGRLFGVTSATMRDKAEYLHDMIEKVLEAQGERNAPDVGVIFWTLQWDNYKRKEKEEEDCNLVAEARTSEGRKFDALNGMPKEIEKDGDDDRLGGDSTDKYENKESARRNRDKDWDGDEKKVKRRGVYVAFGSKFKSINGEEGT